MAYDEDEQDPKGAGKAVNAVYTALRSDAALSDHDELATLVDEALADDEGEAVEDWPTSLQDFSEHSLTDDPTDVLSSPALDPMSISGIPPETQESWEVEEVAGDDQVDTDPDGIRSSDY